MNRSHRLLSIYTRFLQRKKLDKLELSTEFKVSERTIIRDIQEITFMIMMSGLKKSEKEVITNKLENTISDLTDKEIKNVVM